MKHYRLKFVFCANAEILGIDDESCGSLTIQETANQAVSAMADKLAELGYGYEFEEDRQYNNWSGGKFAGAFCPVNCTVYAVDEDGDLEYDSAVSLKKHKNADTLLTATQWEKLQNDCELIGQAAENRISEIRCAAYLQTLKDLVGEFNQQWQDYEEITADPVEFVRFHNDEFIEIDSDPSSYLVFKIEGKEYQISWHQKTDGKYVMSFRDYETDE